MSPWQPGAPRTLTPEQLGEWKDRLSRSATEEKRFYAQGDRAIARYAEAVTPEEKKDVNVLLDFRHVEGTKAQLFHQTPEVTLVPQEPADPTLPIAQVLPYRQKLLNLELGDSGSDVMRALHKSLLETIAASGSVAVEIGFEQVSIPSQMLQPDPMNPMAPPVPVTVQVPIWSRRFIEPIGRKKIRIPDDFVDSSNFDAAPWLALRGKMSVLRARRTWGATIPKDWEGTTGASEDESIEKTIATKSSDRACYFTKVWYRAAEYDETVLNPELFRCLIFVDGIDDPVWHIDSPYQKLLPTGELAPESMIGNPIHIGTLRDHPDSAHVPADLVVGEQLSLEENKFRTDLIWNRKSRRQVVLVAEDLGQDVINKITKNEGAVSIPSSYIDAGGGQRAVAIVAAGSEPRDNFVAQDYIERDYEQALGQSANQQGQFAKSTRSATEVRAVQGNASARADTQRSRFRKYFIGLVMKYDSLIQLTMSQADVQKRLGAVGAQLWEQWRALPGRYTYSILPDAGQYVDAKEYQASVVDLYNLLRKDERVNTEELLTMVARAFHRDPAKFIAPPSGKTMEPPKPSVSFTVEDLHDPVGGQLFLELLKAGGVEVSPTLEALIKAAGVLRALAGPIDGTMPDGSQVSPHGGSADRTEPINQHARQNTGKMQGNVQ